MKVAILEHNDATGPEVVDLPEDTLPPPVRLGIGPRFRLDEGYWLIPLELIAGAIITSRETPDGFALTIGNRTYQAPLGPRVIRGRLQSRSRTARGPKLRRGTQ